MTGQQIKMWSWETVDLNRIKLAAIDNLLEQSKMFDYSLYCMLGSK